MTQEQSQKKKIFREIFEENHREVGLDYRIWINKRAYEYRLVFRSTFKENKVSIEVRYENRIYLETFDNEFNLGEWYNFIDDFLFDAKYRNSIDVTPTT